MTKPISFTRRFGAVLGALALFGASAAQADRATDLDAQAAAAFNRGLDARDAGDKAAACRHFRNAANLYESSIYALMSRSMASDSDREYIKSAADSQQTRVDQAKAKAREVC